MKKVYFCLFTMVCLLFITNISGQQDATVDQERPVKKFSAISAKEGIDLILTQGNDYKVTVTADKNEQDEIIADVENGILKIYPKQGYIKNRVTVKVVFKKISSLYVTKGVDVKATSPVHLKSLVISGSIGCNIMLNVNSDDLSCYLSEGCEMLLAGNATVFSFSMANESGMKADISGSEISGILVGDSKATLTGNFPDAAFSIILNSELNAYDLITENCSLVANEGCEGKIHVTQNLLIAAKASSDVKYKGNPALKDISNTEDCQVQHILSSINF